MDGSEKKMTFSTACKNRIKIVREEDKAKSEKGVWSPH